MENVSPGGTTTEGSEFDVVRIKKQLKVWGENLLDLTKSNPLLGINRSRVSKLQVKDADTSSIFKTLVLDGLPIKMPLILIKRKPIKLTRWHTESESDKDEEDKDEPKIVIHPGDIDFDSEPIVLHRLLKRIYDNGRTTVEERGVTTLFLTFGILDWNDPVLGKSSSPLLLVPCQLENRGVNSNMHLKMLDEELQVNPALEYYLRKKQQIELPKFINENEEFTEESLKKFYSSVKNCVSEQGWDVEDKCWLSTFSFESLVIYKDLENMAEIACENPLIAALANARKISESREGLGEDIDNLDVPSLVPIPVLPADASQLEALTISQSGKHLIIKGPPGTGKSQTITNLIADAIGKGKKVLFVSAKMAALDVVHARLKKLHLDRFCLEAHSTKAGKLKIVEELKRTLELPINNDGIFLKEQLEEWKKLKLELNNYVNEIHKLREPLAETIYQVIGKVEKLQNFETLDFNLPWVDVTTVTRDDLNGCLEALQSLSVQFAIFDNRSAHPWRGFIVKQGEAITSDAIKKNLLTIKNNFESLNNCLENLSNLLAPSESYFRFSDLRGMSELLNSLSTVDGLPEGWLNKTDKELKELENLFQDALEKSEDYQTLKDDYQKITSLTTKKMSSLLRPIKNQFSSWTHALNPKFYKWRSSIRNNFKSNANLSFSSLKKYLIVANTLNTTEAWFNTNNKTISKSVSDPENNPELIKKATDRIKAAIQMKAAITTGVIKKPNKEIAKFTSSYSESISNILEITKNKDLESAMVFIETSWGGNFVANGTIESSPCKVIEARSIELLDAISKMHEWIVLQTLITRCESLGLTDFLSKLEKISAEKAPEIFEKKFYSQWTEALLNANTSLLEFSGALREEKISRFKTLDRKLQESVLKQILYEASEPARGIKTARNTFIGGEIGILQRELQKRKRIKPLRTLFNEIPHVLQTLKPCMLMSPVSVSTFLKPGSVNFDLVVFDEASQLPTQDAIPAILRGKQVIVAGDENQLPPTSFFSASTIFDEENELDEYEEFEPLESLLDNCIAIEPVFQESKIVWHYRSKDERLIEFSNNKFYGNSLITFPASTTETEGRGVHLVYTKDGTWDRGKSRTNRIEAKRVAELVVEQLKKYPDRSLGVASMNSSQKEAIENALDELVVNKLELQTLLDPSRSEPFFVKSLENVQGDERDTIIICVGYAKTPDGSLSLNFGPINNEGGWRRLNVLVTRAKWEVFLVTSLQSHELSGINPLNKGALMLREYIRYAEQGGTLPSEPATTTDGETNDFEDAIAEALRDRGLKVDAQVGASEYRIDLAIRDPRDLNRYIMAVECDGATYHHTKTARDRDILRQEVLQNQGWKIYRVWSTDWFRDSEESLKGILSYLEIAKKTPIGETVQATPMIPELSIPEGVKDEEDYKDKELPNVKKKFNAGDPYEKFTLAYKRKDVKELLNIRYSYALVEVIKRIVNFESPIHKDLILERLKEIYGVSKAGANIRKNLDHALERSVSWSDLKLKDGFLYSSGPRRVGFRIPGNGITRDLNQIPQEEIENAIMYLVEDQFGFARERIAKAILEVFEIGRNRTESFEPIESAIDELIKEKRLSLNGHMLYL